MTLRVAYVGEDLVTRMANTLQAQFLDLCPPFKKADAARVSSDEDIAFPEVKLQPYADIAFDGASRVDMVFLLTEGRGVPFEIKLGSARLSKSRIDGEWLNGCEVSKHGDKRFQGNMMSILERKFPPATPTGTLTAVLSPSGRTVTLTQEWFIVAKRSVIRKWHGNDCPKFSANVKFLAFEDIVAKFGDSDKFNAVVKEMLDFNYYNEWVGGDEN